MDPLLGEANAVFLENFRNAASFERAIFLSWYCSKADCSFCYMSTQKERISDPKLARRSRESVLAEALISAACGWGVEFLSGGYESYSIEEIGEIAGQVSAITGRKQWLNIGAISDEDIAFLSPHLEGVCAAVECPDPELRKKLCPSKPLGPMSAMLKKAKELGLKASATFIIGLGESIDDFAWLESFVREHSLDRITFYALNPHKETPFTKGPDSGYYAQWLAKTRLAFPKMEIIAGSWVSRLSEIPLLLSAGANSITKFPAIKLFGTRYARMIENGAREAGREFKGTLTRMPSLDDLSLILGRSGIAADREKIMRKTEEYLSQMRRHSAI